MGLWVEGVLGFGRGGCPKPQGVRMALVADLLPECHPQKSATGVGESRRPCEEPPPPAKFDDDHWEVP